MIIAAIINLVISAFFLNIGFNNNSILPAPGLLFRGNLSGKVLGVSEFLKQYDIGAIEQEQEKREDKEGVKVDVGEYLDKIVVKAVEEVKNLPLLEISQSKISGQQPEKLPINHRSIEEKDIEIPGFNLSATSGAVLDCQGDNLIFAKKANQPWPIASITKLVTALVFLDYNPGWDEIYEIRLEDRREGGRIYLFTGDKIKVRDLFYFSLVGSDNTATIALIKATGLTEEDFVLKMNEKMHNLGLKRTQFKDPVGLNNDNTSTASEVAKFSEIAMSDNEISKACLTKKYEFTTTQGRKKIIYNTNELLNSFHEDNISILGGKTGHVEASGYCLVGKFKNEVGWEIITVVLGAESDNARFSQTEELVKKAYQNIK